ncbi:MAG: AAA family ATPase [Nitrososphaerales archaeon]
MPRALEVLSVDYLRCLIFGPSGYGKTWLYSLTAFVDAFLPMEIEDFDLGTITLRSSLAELAEQRWDQIEINIFRDLQNPGASGRALLARIRELNRKITLGEPAPKTVVLDSLTFMAKDMLDGVANDDQQPYAKRDHYLPQMMYIEKAIQGLTALKCNVIVIGHEDVGKDEFTGAKAREIDVTGKLSGRLPRYFNEVYYLTMGTDEFGNSKRIIRTVGDATLIGPKTAFPDIIRPNEEATKALWERLASKIRK